MRVAVKNLEDKSMERATNMIRVTAYGETKDFPNGTLYSEIARAWSEKTKYQVLLVREGNSVLHEMNRSARHDCDLTFLTLQDKEGRDTYKRSLCLLMLKAFENVLGKNGIHVWIRFTVSGGMFCTLEHDGSELTQELLDKVKLEMRRLSDLAIPIEKRSMRTNDAIRLFEQNHMTDKAKLFRYRISSRTNIYCMDGFHDYYYG